ncbi:hypothetical protein [Microbacterium sp. CJ88]|uniref:hypothetical protein n=1 Tax=Microbacterium sp. CJ88 TaxID=3445672 RepID=UPI003F659D15
MGVYGADVAQLRGTATELDRAAERLASISTTLGSALESAPWYGADAASFRSHWSSDYSRRIADGSARLREAARTLRANADDQERTSAAAGGSAPGTGPGGHSGAGANPGKGGGGVAAPDGSPKIVVGADGEAGPLSLKGRVGASAQFDDNWNVAGVDVHRQGDYGVGAKGQVGGNFTFSGDENRGFTGDKWGDKDIEKPGSAKVELGVLATGKAGAWAEDKLTAELGVASGSAGYEALAGARADAGAGLKLTDDGLEAGAKLGGFAGAEAKGTLSGEVAGLSGGVTAGVRAGIGAEASVTADIGLDKVKFEFELGASLGVGFSIKPSISFSPVEMASDVKKLFGF